MEKLQKIITFIIIIVYMIFRDFILSPIQNLWSFIDSILWFKISYVLRKIKIYKYESKNLDNIVNILKSSKYELDGDPIYFPINSAKCLFIYEYKRLYGDCSEQAVLAYKLLKWYGKQNNKSVKLSFRHYLPKNLFKHTKGNIAHSRHAGGFWEFIKRIFVVIKISIVKELSKCHTIIIWNNYTYLYEISNDKFIKHNSIEDINDKYKDMFWIPSIWRF